MTVGVLWDLWGAFSYSLRHAISVINCLRNWDQTILWENVVQILVLVNAIISVYKKTLE